MDKDGNERLIYIKDNMQHWNSEKLLEFIEDIYIKGLSDGYRDKPDFTKAFASLIK
jgi:hypothetical protein